MAQPWELPLNPSPPGTELPKLNVLPMTAKRRRDDFEGGETSAAKRQARADVIFRIVVPSGKIGKVIGKQGHRIQKIREDTKATIKIADAVARHEERVIIISSKESENGATDAENALRRIAELILNEDDGGSSGGGGVEIGKLVNAGHVAANTIRLLIAGSQAGSLIGMSGQNIVKLRNSSGAMITVLAPNQLPLCASAYESDRVVQISGDVPVVLKALEEIGCQLRENPPKQVISISPSYNYSAVPFQQYAPQAAGDLIVVFIEGKKKLYLPTVFQMLIFLCYNHIIFRTTNLAADYVTMEMMVPETMMGGLIGRSGSNISRIRVESGAVIKVHGGKGAQKHRHIQLAGSSQQVALAKQRVDEYIYSQLVQQAGTQHGWNISCANLEHNSRNLYIISHDKVYFQVADMMKLERPRSLSGSLVSTFVKVPGNCITAPCTLGASLMGHEHEPCRWIYLSFCCVNGVLGFGMLLLSHYEEEHHEKSSANLINCVGNWLSNGE
ncbi:hypothetical protein NC653_032432 [Populus alba x Populus x berolinensis]|uniref:K Homology domain-containing protein n=1 Tax=Populus alba x Populus x berolinensis TaxID=444605 RepID=A0AAD6LRS2_9ROSI|nr:hypothetical protein NC653_032432 [Populus alba x Populus x berolinensis]